MTAYRKSMKESLAEMRDLQENNMVLMRKAAGQGGMQTLKMKDGKLKMDKVTASAIMQVYDKLNPANQKKMEQMINNGKKSGIIKVADFAMSKVTGFKSEETELDEAREKSARQLVDPKKEVMVVKKNKVVVIDKKDQDKYLKQGWELAEETELDEGKIAGSIRWVRKWKESGLSKKEAHKRAKEMDIHPKVVDDLYQKEEIELDEWTVSDVEIAMKKKYGKIDKEAIEKLKKVQYRGNVDRNDLVKVGHNSYRLEGDRGAIQVQVYNKGGSKPYELNFYKEEVEIDRLPDMRDALMQVRAEKPIQLDEGSAQVLAHGGKGQFKVVRNKEGVIDVMHKGKVISSGDYDRGAGSFFMNIAGEKGQKSFDKPQDIADYFAKNKITEQLTRLRGDNPADQARRARGENDIVDAKKKGYKKEVARLQEDEIADEAYRPSSFRDVQFPTKGVKRGTRKDLMRLEKELQNAKKKKDKAKEAALQTELELLMKSGLGKKIGPSWMHKEELDVNEDKVVSRKMADTGVRTTKFASGKRKVSDASGTKTYSPTGQQIKYKTPTIGGYSRTEIPDPKQGPGPRGKRVSQRFQGKLRGSNVDVTVGHDGKAKSVTAQSKDVKVKATPKQATVKVGPASVTRKIAKEELEIFEGRMKELHMYIQQGKSAKEIAKLMKLDVKTIKALMSEAWEVGTDEYREYLERLTPGEMYYLPSENNPNNPRTYDPNQPADIDEEKFQVKTAKTKRGRISVKEFDNLNAAKKYLEDMKKKGHNGIISQGGKPVKEEAEIEEASARADAKRAMRSDPSMKQNPFLTDVEASDEDIKGASKNIIMQMRKAVSLRGTHPVEFLDKKKVKIPVKIAQAVQDKYNSFRKPADKAKFQARVAKSHKDMLLALKENVEVKSFRDSVLDRVDDWRHEKGKSNG